MLIIYSQLTMKRLVEMKLKNSNILYDPHRNFKKDTIWPLSHTSLCPTLPLSLKLSNPPMCSAVFTDMWYQHGVICLPLGLKKKIHDGHLKDRRTLTDYVCGWRFTCNTWRGRFKLYHCQSFLYRICSFSVE